MNRYIKTFKKRDFEGAESFFTEEAERYELGMRRPIAIQLGSEVNEVPPRPPSNDNVLQTMLWSLQFRWLAWQNSLTVPVPVPPDVRLYLLLYHADQNKELSHSAALNKERIGRVNLFGDRAHAKQNLVIAAYELLHALTATDKYDLHTGLPIYPDGYADPDKQPRYPEHYAELMCGYVSISPSAKEIPASLNQTLIMFKTAKEIGWIK